MIYGVLWNPETKVVEAARSWVPGIDGTEKTGKRLHHVPGRELYKLFPKINAWTCITDKDGTGQNCKEGDVPNQVKLAAMVMQ